MVAHVISVHNVIFIFTKFSSNVILHQEFVK
jgi:hypothetical protein